MKTTEIMMPSAIERKAGDGTSSTADSEISTVIPENRTALPAVSIVTAAACAELSPLALAARKRTTRNRA